MGLEVHEEPRLCAENKETLKPGMIVTIEPGVYLPGKLGIRIEDMVLVTSEGCEVLSSFPRDLGRMADGLKNRRAERFHPNQARRHTPARGNATMEIREIEDISS